MLDTNIKQLTFFRFVAALWVMAFHFVVNIKTLGFKIDYLDNFFKNGNLAVNFFFVLSGFILTHVELRNTSSDFYDFFKKRIFRIYPVYILSLLFSFGISLFYQDVNLISVLANVFSLQAIYPKLNTHNVPTWSVSQEFMFYLLFIPIFLFIKNNSKLFNRIFFFVLIVALIVNQFYFNNSIKDYPQYLWLFTSFIIGILSRYILRNPQVHSFFKTYTLPLSLASMVAFVVCIEILRFNFFYGHVIYELIFAFFIICISCINKDTLLYNIFSNKVLVFLGEISFSIYILQHPLYILSGMLITGHPRYRFLAFVVTLFITSALAYLYIEKPARTLLQKKYITNKL